MGNILLEQAKQLLKAAQADPEQFAQLNKAFKDRFDKKKAVAKADLNGGATAPSMSGPSNTMGAYGKGEKKPGQCPKCQGTGVTFNGKPCTCKAAKNTKKAETNPDKEADAKLGEQVEHDVENHMAANKGPERQEGHKVSFGKSEVARALAEDWTPKFLNSKQFESLEKASKKSTGAPKTSGHKHKIPKPIKATSLVKQGMPAAPSPTPAPAGKPMVPPKPPMGPGPAKPAMQFGGAPKPSLKKDWIKSEEISKALKEDWKPRFRQ